MVRIFSLIFCLIYFVGCASVEKQPYSVIKKTKDIEIRQYPPHLRAQMQIKASFSKAGDKAFRPLFNYISGENISKEKKSGEKIDMTAPVLQESSKKIAMTAPVIQQQKSNGQQKKSYMVSFVMPKKYTLKTIPQPKNEEIKIVRKDEQCMAAIKYSGSWSKKNYTYYKKKLLNGIENENIKPISTPIFARYNSPFTLWFLRRNEVMVEIAMRHCKR